MHIWHLLYVEKVGHRVRRDSDRLSCCGLRAGGGTQGISSRPGSQPGPPSHSRITPRCPASTPFSTLCAHCCPHAQHLRPVCTEKSSTPVFLGQAGSERVSCLNDTSLGGLPLQHLLRVTPAQVWAAPPGVARVGRDGSTRRRGRQLQFPGGILCCAGALTGGCPAVRVGHGAIGVTAWWLLTGSGPLERECTRCLKEPPLARGSRCRSAGRCRPVCAVGGCSHHSCGVCLVRKWRVGPWFPSGWGRV